MAQSLTWDGHEFLDSARDDNNWFTAKQIAKDKGSAFAFESVNVALAEMIKYTIKTSIMGE